MAPTAAAAAANPNAPASSDMTGCDLWFSLASTSGLNFPAQHQTASTSNRTSKTLAHFCECRDTMASEQSESEQNDDNHQSDQFSHVVVGQLDCGSLGEQPDEMLHSFELLLRLTAARQLELKVDYLTIRLGAHSSRSISSDPARPVGRLRADQLAISLDNLQQLDSGLSLVQLEQLQTLSLSVEPAQESATPNLKPNPNDAGQLNAATLNNLTALQRLEISLDHHRQVPAPLALDLTRQAHKLKWLSVSSRLRPVQLVASDTKSVLSELLQLEHLSLEWNQLEQFHLFAHFPRGQPNLFTLNLANNKLKSLKSDLFCCGNQSGEPALVEFSSLSQLDLSSNRLEAIDQVDGRTIRNKMPNLANLYLQHNKIKHLHLGALLAGTKSLQPTDRTDSVPLDRVSQLEFIDLSHNQLSSLIAVQLEGGLKTRLRTINLAHNHLRRPISLIGSRMMQLLETNSSGELVQLDSMYELSEAGLASSLCDYLSARAENLSTSATKTTEAQTGASTLAELLLGHNQLERLERRHFRSRSCSSLEIVRLNDNQISVIEQEAFREMDSLQELDLSGNKLVELSAGLFVGLSELRLLNLVHNSLAGRLDLAGAFGQQPEHLHELRLAHNQIEQLELWPASNPANGTSGQRLELLDLAHNRLTLSSNGSLRSLLALMSKNNQLAEMRLEGNEVVDFDWMQTLEQDDGRREQFESRIDRVGSKASDQDRARPKQHKQLLKVKPRDGATGGKTTKTKSRKASLSTPKADRKRSARQISAPTESATHFEGIKLTTGSALILSNNRLGSFGGRRSRRAAEALAENNNNNFSAILCNHLFMRNLQMLLLDNNSIREIASSSFRCLQALEVLDLQANQLRIVDELAFSHLAQLRQLNLANNYLIRMAPRQFESNRLLARLDLSRNQLTSFEWPRANNKSSNWSCLELLDLGGNQALRLNSAELWPILATAVEGGTQSEECIESRGLRQLNLSGVMSLWSPRQGFRQLGGKSLDRLSLEELDLGDINQLDWSFLELILDHGLGLKRLRVSLKPMSDEDGQLSLMETLTRIMTRLRSNQLLSDSLSELILSNGQLNNQILSKAITSSAKSPQQEKPSQMKLNRLDLSRNALSRWPFEADGGGQLREFFAADQLIELNLSRNRLGDQLIGPSSSANETLQLFGMISLERLNLSSNSLTGLLAYKMDDDEEKQLKLVQLMPRLRQLDLAHNKLGWLPASFFTGLNQLERLDLSHNQLVWRRAHLNSLAQSSNLLLSLDLSFNSELLDGFEPSTGSSSLSRPKLETGNLLFEPDEDLVIRRERASGAISCSSLNLQLFGQTSNYQLGHHDETSSDGQDAQVGCAAHLARILTIDLDGSCGSAATKLAVKLATDNGRTAAELTDSSKLASVSLAQNGLSSLDSVGMLLAAISDNSKAAAIIHLDVSRNNLSNLDGESLCRGQSRLRSLELRDQITGLTEFDLASFSHCRQLVFLDFSHNRLSSIKSDTSTRARNNLQALDLSHNQLGHLLWLASLLDASPNLRQLDLRFNRLKETSSIGWVLERIKLRRAPFSALVDLKSGAGIRNQFPARHRLEITPDDSGLRIQPSDTRGAEGKLVVELSLLEPDASNRRLAYEVDAATSHLFLFCSMRRQLAHRLCLNSSNNLTELAPVESFCFVFRPPKGPTCLTNLETGIKPTRTQLNTPTNQAAPETGAETSGQLLKLDPDQSDWLLNSIEAIKRNWIKMKHFDLGAYLANISQIQEDSVLFYVAGSDRRSGPLPVYTMSLIKLGLAAAALCVVLLAIAMFVLLSSSSSTRSSTKSSGITSKGADSSGDSSQREDPNLSCSSSGSTSTTQSRHRLRLAPSKLANDSPGGSAFLDDSSATITTTTTTGGSGGNRTGGGPTSHPSRPPVSSSGSFELTPNSSKMPARSEHHHDEFRNADSTLQRVPSNIRHNQQLYCLTPASSLAPSSVETGETMQAVDSLQGSTGGSTLCYPSPQLGFESQTASRPTFPVHSVDQYAMYQQSIYNQLTAPPVATVMRMVKSSTFNNANALDYAAAPNKLPPIGCDGRQTQKMSEDMRQAPQVETVNSYNLLIPQSISLMSMAGHELSGQDPNGQASDLHELDPATLSLLSLNSQLSSKAGQEKSADTGLCQFHSKFLQDSHKQQASGYTLLDQTLLEQEDEQSYANEPHTSQPGWFHQNQMEYPAAPPSNP